MKTCGKPAVFVGNLNCSTVETYPAPTRAPLSNLLNMPFCDGCTFTPGPRRWHRTFVSNRRAFSFERCAALV